MNSDMSDLTRRLKPVLAPLSKKEERRAVNAATEHFTAEIGRQADLRYRILSTEIRIEKPPKRGAVPERLVRVLIADYTNQRNLEISINGKGKVVQSEVLRGLQPAFHPDEIQEAKEFAQRDQRVARLAKTTGAFAGAFASDLAHERGRRLVGLHYLAAEKGGTAKPLATVVVDLATGEIVDFRDDKAEGGD
jgi:hypothetical protein